MASPPQPVSSGSSDGDLRYAMFEERKRKRMISNRDSARRSRMKKQQHLDELAAEVTKLQEDNNLISQRINNATQMYTGVASDNNVLRAQLSELTDRLRSLNAIIQIAAEVNGCPEDIQEIPDALTEPWQLPCPMQPIIASADMFHG